MDGTLFFVHGTGVRQDAFNSLCDALRSGLQKAGMDGVSLVGCSWGEEIGTSLSLVPKTLPLEDGGVRGLGADASDADVEKARWSLLREDPFLELRLVGNMAPPAEAGMRIAALGPEQATRTALQRLGTTPPDLGDSGITEAEVKGAADALLAMGDYLDTAAQVAGAPNDEGLIEILARAIVAKAIHDAQLSHPEDPPKASLNGSSRDALVANVEAALVQGQTRGIFSDITSKVAAFVKNTATNIAIDRRLDLTNRGTAFGADILFYQKRGDVVRDYVSSAMSNLPRPVVAVGHSLGGIILVDLLSQETHPAVDLLVTAGSQSPLLYAIDSLDRLRPGGASDVVPFTPWLNIYNRSDFLSFCAKRVFPEIDGIDDSEVDPGVPFPESHSAYWYDDEVFKTIKAAWPAHE